MATLYFDGNLKRIYEVPENSSFVVDGGGYRIYTPDDIPSAEEQVFITSAELWSSSVDWLDSAKWSELIFEKTGGAFRFTDGNGSDVFATFDIRLINDWLLVPANYPHQWVVQGNLFPNLATGEDFDTDRVTANGVSPRVSFSDSLQTAQVGYGGDPDGINVIIPGELTASIEPNVLTATTEFLQLDGSIEPSTESLASIKLIQLDATIENNLTAEICPC